MIQPTLLLLVLLVRVYGFIPSAVELECVPLRDCPKLLNLLIESPFSPNTINTLKTSHCGFDGTHPKVWCVGTGKTNCQTPDGILGKCTPVKECQPLLDLLKTPNELSTDIVGYMQKLRCDSSPNTSTISVCCAVQQKDFTLEPPSIQTKSPLPLTLWAPDGTEVPTNPRSPVQGPSLLPHPGEGKCGRQLVPKIIGGKVTEMDEFPWTALLEYYLDSGFSTPCAGALISKKYVVTAAHCTDNSAMRSQGKLVNVILGEFDTRTERDCINFLGIEDCADPPVRIPVEDVIIHPQWYSKPKGQINHDIALIRLAKPVTFTDYIKPICLPSPTLTLKESENLVITGWGQTENSTSSFVKLKTTISVANRNSCVQKYKTDKSLMVGDGEICVGGEEGKDSCSGDSGGPLMFSVDRSGIQIWFLVGVVSFGTNNPCGVKDYPGLYTYLPKYIEWIHDAVKP